MDKDHYIEAKKQTQEGLLQASQQHDKAILVLSAGAFGVSLAFLKDIAPHPQPETLWLLCCAWASLIASIVGVLVSFHFSTKVFQRHDQILDGLYGKQSTDTTNNWTKATTVANLASLVLFVAGITLLAFFAFQNIEIKEKTMGDTPKKVDGGALPTTPPVAREVQLLEGALPTNPPVSPGGGSERKRGAVPIQVPVTLPETAPQKSKGVPKPEE
ncbi:MAG: hypothetical protein HQ567_15510 [Candidatus Nealsonbacteria bacterium]|nr:hypothetical protein [Candidatus Nealsonbacteria bacterium]